MFRVISRIASKPTGCLPSNSWLFGFDFSKLSNSYLVLLLFINLLLLLLYAKSMLFLQLFTLDVLLSWWLLLMCNGCCCSCCCCWSLDARDDDSRRRCISRSNGDFGTPAHVRKWQWNSFRFNETMKKQQLRNRTKLTAFMVFKAVAWLAFVWSGRSRLTFGRRIDLKVFHIRKVYRTQFRRRQIHLNVARIQPLQWIWIFGYVMWKRWIFFFAFAFGCLRVTFVRRTNARRVWAWA